MVGIKERHATHPESSTYSGSIKALKGFANHSSWVHSIAAGSAPNALGTGTLMLFESTQLL